MATTLHHLNNGTLTVSFNELGGVMSGIQHQPSPINPIQYKMPRYAGSDLFYEGHFICTPRWGDPSAGEAAKGLLKHGNTCNIPWQVVPVNDYELIMMLNNAEEKISIERTVQLHRASPLVSITETISNTAGVYRPCNLTQHPVIAGTFLHNATRVDCNGGEGYRYQDIGLAAVNAGSWPNVTNTKKQDADLRLAKPADEGVYSFNISDQKTGWITALDPSTNLLLGYCWNAADYPWIHHWIHTENNTVVYRGLEFGTAGLHQPFDEINRNKWWTHQQKSSAMFLDINESRTFTYHAFLLPVPHLTGIKKVDIDNDTIIITPDMDKPVFSISMFDK